MNQLHVSAHLVEDQYLEACIIAPQSTIRSALQAIDDGAIGVSIACDRDRRFVGIMTDGDVRRALLRGASLDTSIDEVLVTEPYWVDATETRDNVLDAMQARGIDVVPIITDGKLAGAHTLLQLVGRRPLDNLAVIMAGGKGTRLGPLTRDIPKPMLEVAGRPILERIIQKLVGHGVRNIAISVNYLSDVIVDHFGDGGGFGCSITYLHEQPNQPLGTGGSLALLADAGIRPKIPLIVMNGDILTDVSFADLLEFHEAQHSDFTVCTATYSHAVPFGVVDAGSDAVITAMTEKPTTSWRVNAGIYAVSPDVLDKVVPGVEFPIIDLVDQTMGLGGRVVSYHLDSPWVDIGRPAELKRARGEG